MTTQQMIDDVLKEFDREIGHDALCGLEYKGKGCDCNYSDAISFIQKSLTRVTEVRVLDILNFLDKLEMEQPQDLKTDNWRNWKYIRNSIVDKYKLATPQAETDLNDQLPFKHGSEGTHHACKEMIDKYGAQVGCCTCNNHECQPQEKEV